MEQREGKIFNLRPELTQPMRLAASFAITYYGFLLVFAIITVIFSQYYIDSYYYEEANVKQDKSELLTPILQLALLITLVFSRIQPNTDLQKKESRQSHLCGCLHFAYDFPIRDNRR